MTSQDFRRSDEEMLPQSEAEEVAGRLAVLALQSTIYPDQAPALQAMAMRALKWARFNVQGEWGTSGLGDYRHGRIDIVATAPNGCRVAIELDGRRPRKRSIEKLLLFPGFRIIATRGVDWIEPPERINRVIGLRVRQATEEEKSDRRIYHRSTPRGTS